MSKQGQHQEEKVDPSEPRGHEHSRYDNNPEKSVDITTQSYKKGSDASLPKNNPGPAGRSSHLDTDEELRQTPDVVANRGDNASASAGANDSKAAAAGRER